MIRGLFLETGVDGVQVITGDPVSDGFDVALTVDEEGKLHWTGSGDMPADRIFINGDAQDDGMFTGAWSCGDVMLDIELRLGVYSVQVAGPVSDRETAYWDYVCTLNGSGELEGTGGKTLAEWDENGGFTVTEVSTAGQVVFTLDGGAILWNETVEGAGEGMRFERWAE